MKKKTFEEFCTENAQDKIRYKHTEVELELITGLFFLYVDGFHRYSVWEYFHIDEVNDMAREYGGVFIATKNSKEIAKKLNAKLRFVPSNKERTKYVCELIWHNYRDMLRYFYNKYMESDNF